MFIGYSDHTKDGYRVWNPSSNKVLVRRTVSFREQRPYFEMQNSIEAWKSLEARSFMLSIFVCEHIRKSRMMTQSMFDTLTLSNHINIQG